MTVSGTGVYRRWFVSVELMCDNGSDMNAWNEDEFVSVKEAARRSGYSSRQIQHLLKSGVLPGRKIARDWIVRWRDVAAYKAKGMRPGRRAQKH